MRQMIKTIWTTARANQRLVIITFELFWIVIFVLDRIGQAQTGGVPQFVYVNF